MVIIPFNWPSYQVDKILSCSSLFYSLFSFFFLGSVLKHCDMLTFHSGNFVDISSQFTSGVYFSNAKYMTDGETFQTCRLSAAVPKDSDGM